MLLGLHCKMHTLLLGHFDFVYEIQRGAWSVNDGRTGPDSGLCSCADCTKEQRLFSNLCRKRKAANRRAC